MHGKAGAVGGELRHRRAKALAGVADVEQGSVGVHRLVQHIQVGAVQADDDRERALAVLVGEYAKLNFSGFFRQGGNQRSQFFLGAAGVLVQHAAQCDLVVVLIHLEILRLEMAKKYFIKHFNYITLGVGSFIR